MELVFIFGFGIAILIILIGFRSETKKRFIVINKRIIKLQKEFDAQHGTEQAVQPTVTVTQPIQKPAQKVIKPLEQKPNTVETPTEKVLPKKLAEPNITPVVPAETSIQKEEIKKVTPQEDQPEVKKEAQQKVTATKQQESKAAKPIEKQSKPPKDYEKVIGENWLNKIGIAILVIGIGFFVKYAIDQNWIGEVGRVAIGIGTGAALIGIAHFLKNNYRAFSSVLIGGGLSIFYYTISIAYHDYGIFNQNAAFIIMSVITLFSTLLSLFYDRKELAIIALLGGFSSPFMVQGETANYVAFFSYIAILNTGMLLLSYFKKWVVIQRLALGFTLLFFGGWMLMTNFLTTHEITTGFTFASIFFAQFLTTHMGYNLRNKVKFSAWEFIQLLSTIGLYYAGMMYLMMNTPFENWMGAFTIILAAVLAGIGFMVYSNKEADHNLGKFLIAQVVTLVTVFGFVQLEADYLSIFWSVEAVVLLLLGQKMKVQLMKNASVLVTIISLLGLIKIWFGSYLWWGAPQQMSLILNKAFVTAIVSIGTYITTIFLLSKEDENEEIFFLKIVDYKNFLNLISFVGVYLAGLFELNHHLHLSTTAGEKTVMNLYNIGFITAGIALSLKFGNLFRKTVFMIAGLIGIIIYFIFITPNNHHISSLAATGLIGEGFYWMHYPITALFIVMLLLMQRLFKQLIHAEGERSIGTILIAILGLIVGFIELELNAIYWFANSTADIHPIISNVRIAGYTVLTAAFSFIMMITGMRKKDKTLRVFALVAFGATLIKLFAFDIQDISEAGKIIAFISLGVILLIVSFLYQKLKNLIVEGEFEQQEETTLNNVESE